MKQFKKLNTRPLKVYACSYFNYKKKRFNFNDFYRVHNNFWYNDTYVPAYIHGAYFYGNVFVEILSDEYVNVYAELYTQTRV